MAGDSSNQGDKRGEPGRRQTRCGNRAGNAALCRRGHRRLPPEDAKQPPRALETLRAEALGEHQLSVESCDNRERDLRGWLQNAIDQRRPQAQAAARQDHQGDVAVLSRTNSSSKPPKSMPAIEAAAFEYQNMLEKAATPTICRVSKPLSRNCSTKTPSARWPTFNAQLARERETIKERIARINDSLTQIDYNPGRYHRARSASRRRMPISVIFRANCAPAPRAR